ncbi:hypothetical protein ALT1644_440017 [Alteromonas macleodii]
MSELELMGYTSAKNISKRVYPSNDSIAVEKQKKLSQLNRFLSPFITSDLWMVAIILHYYIGN